MLPSFEELVAVQPKAAAVALGSAYALQASGKVDPSLCANKNARAHARSKSEVRGARVGQPGEKGTHATQLLAVALRKPYSAATDR